MASNGARLRDRVGYRLSRNSTFSHVMLKALLSRWADRSQSTPSLRPADVWELRVRCDWSCFLSALPLLELQGGTVAFEGTTEENIARWLSKHASTEGLPIRAGTIWPRSDWWYLPIEGRELGELAALMESAASASIHVYVYDRTGLVIEWHDAFDDPLWIARRVEERALNRFVAAVRGTLGSP